jgi:HSP20 family protein
MLPTLRTFRTVPSIFDELMTNDWPLSWTKNYNNASVPAVNVAENKNEYRIEVAAPGLSKGDFKINLDHDVLTISSEKEESKEEKEENYTRKEFSYTSFSRSFTLPDVADAEKIEASHKDGVLNITIPKREEAKVKPARQIAIA